MGTKMAEPKSFKIGASQGSIGYNLGKTVILLLNRKPCLCSQSLDMKIPDKVILPLDWYSVGLPCPNPVSRWED
jgi:hypothetical protein